MSMIKEKKKTTLVIGSLPIIIVGILLASYASIAEARFDPIVCRPALINAQTVCNKISLPPALVMDMDGYNNKKLQVAVLLNGSQYKNYKTSIGNSIPQIYVFKNGKMVFHSEISQGTHDFIMAARIYKRNFGKIVYFDVGNNAIYENSGGSANPFSIYIPNSGTPSVKIYPKNFNIFIAR